MYMEAGFDFAFFAISARRLSSGGLPGLSFPDFAASHDIFADLVDASGSSLRILSCGVLQFKVLILLFLVGSIR